MISRSACLMATYAALALTAGMAPLSFTFAQSSSTENMAGSRGGNAPESRQASTEHVDKAVEVIRRMEAEPGMAKLLSGAKGVFIVPKYDRGGFIIGLNGGTGVLLIKQKGTWTEPVFYTYGGMSAGAQAGLETGSLAFVLNNDKAVSNFMQNNKFSLDANAGLTIVKWSAETERAAGRGDITAWTNAKGAFGGVAVGVNNIRFDQSETTGYYQREASIKDVIDGKVSNPHSAELRQALAGAAASSSSSGASGREKSESGGAKAGNK